MIQNIRYKGLSLTPDEMAVENGSLSLCAGLEVHATSLRPSFVSGTKLDNSLVIHSEETGTDTVAQLMYVHETGNYRHFIALDSTTLYWFDKDGSFGGTIKSFDNDVTIKEINSVGNTLVVIISDGIHYSQWKNDKYIYIGQKPPFMELSFSLSTSDKAFDYDLGGVTGEGSKNGFEYALQQTTISCDELFEKIAGSGFKSGDTCANIKEAKQSDLTQSVWALVNRTNNKISREGLFYANFMVRYCYRMFDGTMIMHSAPVLMPVQVPNSYLVYGINIYFPTDKISINSQYYDITNIDATASWKDNVNIKRQDSAGIESEIHTNKAAFLYSPRAVNLKYNLKGNVEELKKWNDVIKSIDVFITPPITNIDSSEKITSMQVFKRDYRLGTVSKSLDLTLEGLGKAVATVKFPTMSSDAYKKKLMNMSAFYKVCSLKVSELKTINNSTEVPVNKTAVYQIALQEQMKDDYKSHNSLFSEGCYIYNHRLNLFGVKEKLFKGFSREVMFPYQDSLYTQYNEQRLKIYRIEVILNTTSGKKHVMLGTSTYPYVEQFMLANLVKFYPDSRAEKMYVYATDNSSVNHIYAFDLQECKELNGAIHVGTFETGIDSYEVSEGDDSNIDDEVLLSNKIYTSEADNPYSFPANAINTVGIGTILGVASTTRALSQGQFGQYPLMAFSTDGIWALNVSNTGTYSGIHPISREVCSNPKSITQLDQSVIFATNRSLSKIVESQVASLSDLLNGPYFDISENLTQILDFFQDAEADTEEQKTIKSQMRQLIGFNTSPIEFFQNCQVVYDYKNSRIFCINVNKKEKEESNDTVAFCYSILDDAWSTLLVKNVLTTINSYPHPYIQYRDGSIEVLDKAYNYQDGTLHHGIIVTRTLKFDEDNVPDAITGYVHLFSEGTMPVMWLYGSNDNQTWHYIGRCSAFKNFYMTTRSYRFFRIAIYLKMKSSKNYMFTSLDVIRRFNKF